MRSTLWLIFLMPIHGIAGSQIWPLDPELRVQRSFEGDLPEHYSLDGLGGGLIRVAGSRAGVRLILDDNSPVEHELELSRSWVVAPPSARRLIIEPVRPDPGAHYTIWHQPYQLADSESDPLRLTVRAASLNEEVPVERAQALNLISRALAVWPEDSYLAEQIVVLAREADLHRRDGNHDRALSSLKQAIQLLGDRASLAPWLHFTIGTTYFRLRQESAAEESLCLTLQLVGDPTSCQLDSIVQTDFLDKYWAASAINFLGLIRHYRGELTEASAWYHTALSLVPPWAESRRALIINNLGGVEFMKGNFMDALNMIDEAQAIAEEKQDLHELAAAEGNRGSVYLSIGDLDQAIVHYHRALELEAADGTHDGRVHTEHQIGRMYLELGNLEAAEEFLLQSYELRTAGNLQGSGQSALQLGRLRREQGGVAAAQALHAEALSQFRLAGRLHDEFAALLELTLDALAAQDFSSAESRLENAGELIDRIDDQRLRGKYFNLRGVLLARSARLDDAFASFEKALQSQRVSADKVGEIDTHYQIALVLEAQGRFEDALEVLDQTTALISKSRLGVSNHSLRASFTGMLMDVPGKQIELLMKLGRTEAALDVALSSRTRVLFESVVYQANASNSPSKRRAQQLKRLLAAKSEARRTIAARWPGSAELKIVDGEMKSIRIELDALEAELLAGRVGMAGSVSMESLQAFLPENAALLVHWVGEQESWRWQLTRSSLETFTVPGRRELERMINAAHHDWLRMRAFPTPALMAVSPVVLGAPDTNRFTDIYIIPDDLTSMIPFNALPTQNGKALIDEARVTVIPGASLIDRVSKEQPDNTAILIADPVFSAQDPRTSFKPTLPPANNQYQRLVFSGDEVQAVAQVLAEHDIEVKQLSGFDANKDRFLSSPKSRARVLHFATHGEINQRRPQASGLVFSQITESGTSQTGLLSLAEIYDLDIRADLVVLSACDSAIGNSISGEGPISLARGFLISGARQVVASLWPVDDVATRHLMEHFYRSWAETGSSAEALRQAQIALMQRPRWRSARYWGAFVLVGV